LNAVTAEEKLLNALFSVHVKGMWAVLSRIFSQVEIK
jgi:hypothetical protein